MSLDGEGVLLAVVERLQHQAGAAWPGAAGPAVELRFGPGQVVQDKLPVRARFAVVAAAGSPNQHVAAARRPPTKRGQPVLATRVGLGQAVVFVVFGLAAAGPEMQL